MGSLTAFDLTLLGLVRDFHTPWLDMVMSVLTISGIMAGVWQLIALISLFVARTRAGAFRALLALWLGLFLVDVFLKPIFARPRPAHATDHALRLELAEDAEARGLAPSSDSYSFPSGHATSAFAGAFTVSHMWPRAYAVWWSLAVLISYSRIYLGHHYPIDVIAGALLGLAIGFWVTGGRMIRQPHRAA